MLASQINTCRPVIRSGIYAYFELTFITLFLRSRILNFQFQHGL